MSSIWSSGAAQASISPFSTTGSAPVPGGAAASRFQSLLQSSGGSGQSAAAAMSQLPSTGIGASASQPGLSPAAASSASGVSSQDDSSSSTSSATISANDFLSLLVTEMQNQDPTAQTDPNAYIDQLVQINSLEQLISINQNLSTALGTTSTSTSAQPAVASGVPAKGSHAFGSAPAGGSQAPFWSSINGGNSGPATLRNGSASPIQGNLSVPSASPAARTVAGSLAGHGGAAAHGHAIRDIPTRSLP